MSLSSRITDLATAIGLAVKGKQDTLISGTNIKTINSLPLIGSGNLDIGGTPAGTIITFASATAPTGYLKANGALLSRTTYSALFAAIGTTFGAGDGSTTFALPDLRGYFPRGWDDGRGIDSGRTIGSSQSDDFKTHNHPATGTNYLYSNPSSGNPIVGTGVVFEDYSGGIANVVASQGGTETRPRNIALLYCIKY